MEAVRRSNLDVEGRVLELSGFEYMVRGRGYIKNLKDLEDIAVGTRSLRNAGLFKTNSDTSSLGRISGEDLRTWMVKGRYAGGIVVVRFGENVLNVIERVKEKIKKDIEPSLPKG